MTCADVVFRKRNAKAGDTTYYLLGDRASVRRGTDGRWAGLVYRDDTRGRRRVVRMVYEVGTFQALREQLRRKEVCVMGAGAISMRTCRPTLSPAAASTMASCANGFAISAHLQCRAWRRSSNLPSGRTPPRRDAPVVPPTTRMMDAAPWF